MMMNTFRIRIFGLVASAASILLIESCETRSKDELSYISNAGRDAESVFITQDEQHRPVITWIENDTIANRHFFYFASSDDNGATFNEKIEVPIPDQINTHAEGMPKVAFKGDGTIIAAYEKSNATPENKWAGSIYYLSSTDKGKTWSSPQYLHSDTVSGRSRGFFDIETLSDGEVGASWLDIKADATEKGRTIRFAKTSGLRFTDEIIIEPFACECCRIDLFNDYTGRVNVAYRSVRKGNLSEQVRDIMWASSSDNGKTFTSPTLLSSDKWVINGCPHSGPSLAQNADGLHGLWYTEGNGKGVYFTSHNGQDFEPRQLISNNARHPQLAAGENSLLMVWSETSGEDNLIRYQERTKDRVISADLTALGENGFFPVALATNDDRFVVAFIHEKDHSRRIGVKKLIE